MIKQRYSKLTTMGNSLALMTYSLCRGTRRANKTTMLLLLLLGWLALVKIWSRSQFLFLGVNTMLVYVFEGETTLISRSRSTATQCQINQFTDMRSKMSSAIQVFFVLVFNAHASLVASKRMAGMTHLGMIYLLMYKRSIYCQPSNANILDHFFRLSFVAFEPEMASG